MTMDRWNSRSLFSDDAPEDAPDAAAPVDGAPLAERMRPRALAEFVGQEHLVGEGRILRIEGALHSDKERALEALAAID